MLTEIISSIADFSFFEGLWNSCDESNLRFDDSERDFDENDILLLLGSSDFAAQHK